MKANAVKRVLAIIETVAVIGLPRATAGETMSAEETVVVAALKATLQPTARKSPKGN